MTFRFVLAAALCLPVAVAASPQPAKLAAETDVILREEASKGFGGAVIIRRGKQAVIAQGYGYANRERRIPFTTATISQIGSITKTFTAVAILQLVQARKLELDATVGSYIKHAPEPVAGLTIGELLTHRGGLMNACSQDFAPVSAADFIAKCMARPLVYARGEVHYSNFGYGVLAAVVERMTGIPWDEYVEARILKPLGMENSGYRFSIGDPRPMALGYLSGKAAPPISDALAKLGGNDWNLRGNGGMQASASDMDRFIQALTFEQNSALAPIRSLMLTPGERNPDGQTAEGYGIVFRFGSDGEIWRVGCSGSDGTFFSYMIYYPKSETSIYFVGNNGERAVKSALAKVMLALDRDLETRL